jgi:hypothetical protein
MLGIDDLELLGLDLVVWLWPDEDVYVS